MQCTCRMACPMPRAQLILNQARGSESRGHVVKHVAVAHRGPRETRRLLLCRADLRLTGCTAGKRSSGRQQCHMALKGEARETERADLRHAGLRQKRTCLVSKLAARRRRE